MFPREQSIIGSAKNVFQCIDFLRVLFVTMSAKFKTRSTNSRCEKSEGSWSEYYQHCQPIGIPDACWRALHVEESRQRRGAVRPDDSEVSYHLPSDQGQGPGRPNTCRNSRLDSKGNR